MLPNAQVGNGTPGWAGMDVAQTTTKIEEIVDGQRTVVLEIFQHLSIDGSAGRDTSPPAGPAQVSILWFLSVTILFGIPPGSSIGLFHPPFTPSGTADAV